MPVASIHANEASTSKAAVAVDQTSGPSLPFAPGIPSRPFVDPNAIPDQVLVTPPPATVQDVQIAYAAPAKQSQSNTLGDPTQNLQSFTLNDLALFTKEQCYSTNQSKDVHLFYVGRDDVHDILKYVLSRVTVSLYMNMFGFDDAELNNIIMQKALNPAITMLITLDESQASGVHEKALLEADQKYNLAAFNTHFAIGESKTHQISHTKGFVADGRVAGEGSTNWSDSGEGTFVVQGLAGGPGYKAQNNTQSIITDPDTIVRFQTELIAEHMTITSVAKSGSGAKTSLPLATTPAAAALHKQVAAATTPAAVLRSVTASKAAKTTSPAAAKKAAAKTTTAAAAKTAQPAAKSQPLPAAKKTAATKTSASVKKAIPAAAKKAAAKTTRPQSPRRPARQSLLRRS